MTHGETLITRVLRSRGIAMLLMLLAAAGSWAALPYAPAIGWEGVWLEGPGILPAGAPAWAASVASAVIVAVAMVAVNRVFNLLRTLSVCFAGFFMVMQAATPGCLGSFGPGQILAPAMMAVLALLFSVYQCPDDPRRIFLSFFILGLGASTVAVSFIPFVIVGLAALRVMRVLNPRSIGAALVGLAVGPWILWGFGIIHISRPLMPELPDLGALASGEMLPAVAAIAVTLLGGLCMGVANSYHMLRLNARSRDNYTLLSIVGIAAGALVILDFTRWQAYAGLLNCCTAMQMALFLRLFASARAYIAVLLMLAAYVGCFAAMFIIH